MATEGQEFEQWLRGAKVPPERLTDQQRAVLLRSVSVPPREQRGLFQFSDRHSLLAALWLGIGGNPDRSPGRHQHPLGVPASETLRHAGCPADSTSLQRPSLREALAAACRFHRRVSLHPSRGHARRVAGLHRAYLGISRLQSGPVEVSQEIRSGPRLLGGNSAICLPRGRTSHGRVA